MDLDSNFNRNYNLHNISNNQKLNKMENLTKEELELIIFALNQTFNDAHKKLQGHQLGDIERRMLEKTKEQSKELIRKLID